MISEHSLHLIVAINFHESTSVSISHRAMPPHHVFDWAEFDLRSTANICRFVEENSFRERRKKKCFFKQNRFIFAKTADQFNIHKWTHECEENVQDSFFARATEEYFEHGLFLNGLIFFFIHMTWNGIVLAESKSYSIMNIH